MSDSSIIYECKLKGIHRNIIIKVNHKLLSDETSPVIPKCYWTIVRRERKIFTGRFPSGISLRPILPPGTDRTDYGESEAFDIFQIARGNYEIITSKSIHVSNFSKNRPMNI